MGKHEIIYIQEIRTERPYMPESAYWWAEWAIAIKFHSDTFENYSIKELFAAKWTIKRGEYITCFDIDEIESVARFNEYKEYEIMGKYYESERVKEWSPDWMDEDDKMEAFFCVPPCPSCVRFIKDYPECTKKINGIML